MFGGMSLCGYTTGRDLTGMGSFLIMGVMGSVDRDAGDDLLPLDQFAGRRLRHQRRWAC